MALQLTPFVGTTAFSDRMGDFYPELLGAGRIVQGHNVSGSMSAEVMALVDRDLRDPVWRQAFHEAINCDYRFQRGLFEVSNLRHSRNSDVPDPSLCLHFSQSTWMNYPYQVETVQVLSRTSHLREDSSPFEYGFALIKTAASLIYTIKLCQQLNLIAVTDSSRHHRLLTQTCKRDDVDLTNTCVRREGY